MVEEPKVGADLPTAIDDDVQMDFMKLGKKKKKKAKKVAKAVVEESSK